MMILKGLGVPIIEYPIILAASIRDLSPPPPPPTKKGGKVHVDDLHFTHYVDKASTSMMGLGDDPGVTTGLVVLAILGLGALGVSRVMKRRR
jgi:hypothetical protein